MMTGKRPAAFGRDEKQVARKRALDALGLWLLQGIPIAMAIVFKVKILLLLAVLFMHWGFPLMVAFLLEKRDIGSLGLVFRWRDIGRYLLYAVAGFVVATALHWGEWFLRVHWAGESAKALAPSRPLLAALAMQLATVGLPEELLYRGFFLTRLSDWLGKAGGLFGSALIFGFVHTFSRVLGLGGGYAASAIIIGFSTFLGGIVFGFQFLKTKSIVPSAMSHIVLNLDLFPLFYRLV